MPSVSEPIQNFDRRTPMKKLITVKINVNLSGEYLRDDSPIIEYQATAEIDSVIVSVFHLTESINKLAGYLIDPLREKGITVLSETKSENGSTGDGMWYPFSAVNCINIYWGITEQ